MFGKGWLGIRKKKPEKTEAELKKVTEMVKNKNYNHPEIGVISEGDLQRMKGTMHKPTKEELQQERRLAEEEKEYKLSLAKAKREEMLRMEEEKKKKLPVEEFEKERMQKREALNTRAQEMAC